MNTRFFTRNVATCVRCLHVILILALIGLVVGPCPVLTGPALVPGTAVTAPAQPDAAASPKILRYLTLLAGPGTDYAWDMSVDAAGHACIAGMTDSFGLSGYPEIAYSTFLGGNADVFGGGIAVDADGQALFTGYTESSNFPTTPGAFDMTRNGISDAVVVKLNAEGSDLVYSTFAGGSILYGTFLGTPLANYGRGADAAGHAYLSGYTRFENVNAFGLKLDLMANNTR
jgi:hypothetical protein